MSPVPATARAILENSPSYDQAARVSFLQSWIYRSSCILAITGGTLFLVFPVAFFNGTVSIMQPLAFASSPQCSSYSCPPFTVYQPMPAAMAAFWISLGVIGIFLGFLALKLCLKPRGGVVLGLAFSLGSMVLLFGIVTLQILEAFVTTPASFLVFPELSVVAMAVATVLFSYELVRFGTSDRVNGNKRPPLT